MLNKLMMCGVALALCLGATCLSIMAQDEKPKEDPAKEDPAKEDPAKPDPAKDGIKRSEVPEKFKGLEVPDLKDEKLIAAGKEAYAKSCVGCHGEAGKGDGKYAAKMDPKPTDLTSGEFQDAVTDQYIFWRIKTGDEGYAGEGKSKMKAKASASDSDLWELTAFVRSLKDALPAVEPMSGSEWESCMKGISRQSKAIKAANSAKDKDAATTAGDEMVKLAAKLMGFDGNVKGGDHAGEKARDQADWKQFCKDFQKAAADYASAIKDGDWDKAEEAKSSISEGCSNCHDVYKPKRRRG